MRRLLWGAVLIALAFLTASRASADTFTFTATQLGSNEVPPSGSPATGFAMLVLDTTAMTLKVSETFSGLTSPATVAFIHCCAPTGINTGVALLLLGFPNANSGTYSSTIDLSLSSSYSLAFITANGGIASSADAALSAGLFDGLAYINIHTANFPGGEIRGQFAAVPEPATLTLFGLGLASLGATLRRRRT
jgi:hypothetical protein